MQPTPLRDLPSQTEINTTVNSETTSSNSNEENMLYQTADSAVLQSNYSRLLTRSAVPAAQQRMQLDRFAHLLFLEKIVVHFDSLFKVNLVENCCMLTKAPVVTGSWSFNAYLKVKLQFIHKENWHNNRLTRMYVNYCCFQINMVGLDETGQLIYVQIITYAEPKKHVKTFWV